jgi:hypothetical protein
LRRNFPFEMVLCGLVLRMRPQQGHLSPSHCRNVSHSIHLL